MPENKVELKNLTLECPYCGSGITVLLEENLNRHSWDDPQEIPSGYECANVACWAEWDLTGTPTEKPRSV